MRIAFDLAGTPSEFRWDHMTGNAELQVSDDVTQLQSPLSLGSHLSLRLSRTWSLNVGQHAVEVTKVRPLLLAGLRPNHFTVSVDGAVVARAEGL
jgi:hypothetical protein